MKLAAVELLLLDCDELLVSLATVLLELELLDWLLRLELLVSLAAVELELELELSAAPLELLLD